MTIKILKRFEFSSIYKTETTKFCRLATLDGMAERTINIGSAGKTFSVTGWKTGWAVGPANLMDALQSFHHLTIRGGVSVMQVQFPEKNWPFIDFGRVTT